MFLNIKTPYISYEIEFNRKVTIIQGDSGTGKSKIIETRNEMWDTGLGEIYTSNNIPVTVIGNIPDWERILDLDEVRLFIIDEDCSFILSNRFADIVNKSRSYFIIISRDPLKKLNYSYEDIYEMKNSGKFNRTVRKYNDEDMYYKILEEETNNTPALYTKSCINTCYISNCCHKSCPPCRLYKNSDKKTIVNELIFGSERNKRNDKLLF